MITKDQVTQLANEALENTDRFVVDITVSKSNVIFVYIDADTSVTIDHCVELSRFIEGRLDREVEDYELSVSSAGIDYPLLNNRQFKKYIEKEIGRRAICLPSTSPANAAWGLEKLIVAWEQILLTPMN